MGIARHFGKRITSFITVIVMLFGMASAQGTAMAGEPATPIVAMAAEASYVSGLGVELGGGTTVYANETLNQKDVYSKALAHVIKWRRDALNDGRIKIERTVDGVTSSWSVKEYLSKIGMSEQEYLSPKWSNALERIAVQRAVEAADYDLHHTRPNGSSCFTATYNGIGANGEILAWGGSDIVYAIDSQWASEKQDYINHLSGKDTGETGHYTQLIDPAVRRYGFGQASSPDWKHVFAGETSSGNTADTSTEPTNWEGARTVEVNVSDSLLNRGVMSNLPVMVNEGTSIQATASLVYLSGRYEFRGAWTSSDSSVASITAGGDLKALKAGISTIKVSGQGKSYIFPIQVQAASAVTKQPVYRVYNPNSGLHHYTISAGERDSLVRQGWRDEHVSFNAATGSANLTPVYREYNPNDGNHNWTMNKAEHDMLVRRGWRNENIAWYVDGSATTDVYRLYNPNSGEHVYTTNRAEYDSVQRAGWHGEGVAWKSL
ncbi:hypothetical protein JS528_04910 [Bifidobacterium sp. MA2]|uniref:BIG2 domain-containing protein n=1 Tax=Bifidobacterium santillanense TaxID=2809028 RepID=A0ABS5UP41_9BIFI|nr:CAP domain-containing protein [Bifidobacterium santillanense]MBT1172701.1 hypothetical protein [Bifidobacterium santillanense]